ncbi:hypothetical protein PIB30_022589 [Stylosanthes scabra]|uniref:Uncharacterized protein n=1 Tax=Stylosanthes scabra TaxID=79078 RepID=A0ABU6Q8X8_9FABA|nr:hypothetical protein [Stylosanthes scabra]
MAIEKINARRNTYQKMVKKLSQYCQGLPELNLKEHTFDPWMLDKREKRNQKENKHKKSLTKTGPVFTRPYKSRFALLAAKEGNFAPETDPNNQEIRAINPEST